MYSRDSLYSGAVTETGNSGPRKVVGSTVLLSVAVTAMTTGTVDFTLEWSPDGENFGTRDGGTDVLTQFGATGTKSKAFAAQAPYYRLKWTVAASGDPTFTAAAVQV